MLFSVVIPTCDRPPMLARCLDVLAPGFQSTSAPFEVIVTDDGKTPIREMLARDYPFVTWTQGPRRGPAANRNNGARLSQGQWLAFVDDDCVADRDWLAGYVAAMSREPESRAFEGAILPDRDVEGDLAECPVNLSGGHFWSANICVRRDVFDAVGAFDEAFPLPAYEDQDLYIRLKASTRIPFVEDARVVHPVRMTKLRDMLRDIDRQNKTWIYFATKNATQLNYKSRGAILAAGYYNHLRNGVAAIRRGEPKRFIYHAMMMSIGLPMQGARLLFGPDLQ